ncbi:Hsp20/alpha crystallin family protein [Paucibacter sp. O1-1]|nr:Hsp20/alpha crystallin family protein [Paucibacter sp. O1-1]MDA3825149.1 Hsp20/alpha crystallin family protein [Paucibacter sp. O1-1]
MSDSKQVTTSTSAVAAAEQDLQRAVQPAVDVFEDAGGITLLADMPGVPREQLELKVEGDALLIEGSVQPRTPDGLEAVYAELRVPRYRRSFTLSRELDTSRIEANLKDGVLSLRIPKQAHAQPRRITVNAA